MILHPCNSIPKAEGVRSQAGHGDFNPNTKEARGPLNLRLACFTYGVSGQLGLEKDSGFFFFFKKRVQNQQGLQSKTLCFLQD